MHGQENYIDYHLCLRWQLNAKFHSSTAFMPPTAQLSAQEKNSCLFEPAHNTVPCDSPRSKVLSIVRRGQKPLYVTLDGPIEEIKCDVVTPIVYIYIFMYTHLHMGIYE